MGYAIHLLDPVSHETLQAEEPHFIRGSMYPIGGTTELSLSITYNYARYYYEATEGDERFTSKVAPKGGIRGIYGKTGAESIPMLKDMIERINAKYHDEDGQWRVTEREKRRYYDGAGIKIDDPLNAIFHGQEVREEKYITQISEGPNNDYWEDTAGNALKPLHQLIALAQMRPDGVWDGD